MRKPQDCANMTELRENIDALDLQIAKLLAERAAHIDRAAELKPAEGLPARIGPRVDQVVANARRNAETLGLDADLAEQLWRTMIEWSIAREERVLGS
ncbi:chorismate mutase [Actibacterium mucosum KCTC 23349]|uniref:chorismate mutase n=1 Tax=Actibacterium mucosum KCTC 23349 TaxID=1454373 RepID=A0A037ZD65_9RHOB|nr:chorismate mutase [Actibacterium mucosum]KAJ54097.1 chorismate mutase [Actibacterium mucosum KCTC 23349]